MDRDDRLAELLVRWEDATTSGDPPTLEELCRDCPELLPDSRRLVARVGVVNALLKGEKKMGRVAPGGDSWGDPAHFFPPFFPESWPALERCRRQRAYLPLTLFEGE